MEKKEKEELKKIISNLGEKEKEGFNVFSNLMLKVLSKEDCQAELLYEFNNLTDKEHEIIENALEFKNEEKTNKLINIIKQFIKILDDYKKENF